MNRFDFLGLNANQAACVLLYGIAALWVLNFSVRRLRVKMVFMAMEAALIVAVGMTLSRGGVVTLIVGLGCVWYLRGRQGGFGFPVGVFKKRGSVVAQTASLPDRPNVIGVKAGWQPALRWLFHSPVWRVALVLCNPGLWGRSAPGYIVQDASIGNRLELWKGAAKLIFTSPLGGWGFDNTGAAYMNWFQSVDNHTYYRGMVNSFFQISVAYGLPALFGLLFVSLLALKCGWSLLLVHGRANRPGEPLTIADQPEAGELSLALETPYLWNFKRSVMLLCFLWLVIWGVASCFSTMLSSPMLLGPPMLAALVMLVIRTPQMSELRGALVISFSVCLLLFVAGGVLARGDSVKIAKDANGMVSVVNAKGGTSAPDKTCIICVDQQALGENYGKEVRKFMVGANFGKCVVLDKAGYLDIIHENTNEADLVILSGNTVDCVEIKEGGRSKFVFLNPVFLPPSMPGGQIQAIVWPEIKRAQFLEPEATLMETLRAKIRMVPYNENFEISWSKYIK